MTQTELAQVLGSKKKITITSRFDLVDLGDQGVSKAELLHLAKYLDLSVIQMAEILPVTERTIQRYGSGHRFNKTVSEQLLQVAETTVRGKEVFGNRERFLAWLKSPCPALGNRKPLTLLSSRFGTALVLDELGRIEHGIVS
jgi:putative toxin-antitoxin system antitoxin component (TIGR02293 family)